MRIIREGLISLLFAMIILLDEARHALSHYQAERVQVLDLLNDYLHHHHHQQQQHHNHRHQHHQQQQQQQQQQHHSHRVIVPVPAADGFSTAYLFQGNNRSVEVSGNMLQTVRGLFEASTSFTIITAVKQDQRNVGSIVSLGTEKQRYLEVESSGWRQELRFHYAHGTRTRTETFPYNLADGRWHQLAISIIGATHLDVFIDCELIFQRDIPPIDSFHSLATDDDGEAQHHLWIGQRNTRHVFFKGGIEYLKIVTSGTGYRNQCPHANVACPSCSQFQQLQLSVQQLQNVVSELTKQVEAANRKILELEKCDCRRQCHVLGSSYRDGEEVPSGKRCSRCTCKNGETVCDPVLCPKPRCQHPEIPENGCCPVCLKQCLLPPREKPKKRIEHGEEFKPRPCITYTCKNGNLSQHQIKRESCPKLSCPRDQQIKEINKCCKVCKVADWCVDNSHHCPPNSTCTSLETNFTCSCNQGFVHAGNLCQDVNECLAVGGKEGHHCRHHSECINTVGSYRCKCLPGYAKDDAEDEFSCKEIDFCDQIGRNACSSHAICIRTLGSFNCRCNEGYEGNGFQCRPICSEPCLNGGTCVGVGKCGCRRGYRGRNCDADIDECLEGLADCHPNSFCVNTPGSYHCQCRDGYYSPSPDNLSGALCRDQDECQGWGGGEHCPDVATCHNSIGGYTCSCPTASTGNNSSCNPGCSVDGRVYRDGQTWRPDNDQCVECHCQNGKVVCVRHLINCSGNDEGVCCRDRHTCHHQVLPLSYSTGQRWQYHCHTCQCYDGETDCWPTECPQLGCSDVVYSEDECCPRCSHPDPCSPDLAEVPPSKAATCVFKDRRVEHLQTLLLDSSSDCSVCRCLNGSICCEYNQTCARETRISRPPTPPPPLRLPPLHHRSRFIRDLQRVRQSSIRQRARTRQQDRPSQDNG